MGTIVVVGSVNMDLVIRAPRMPAPGETLTGSDFQVIPGGKGANQAVAAARQGANVRMIGAVGDDDFGRKQRHCLEREGIDLAHLAARPECATGVAVITLDGGGQNSIILSPEANGTVTAEQVAAAAAVIADADMLLCQLEIPLEAVTRAIELAADRGVPVLLNPAPAQPLERALLERVTYLVPNETEAGLLTGIEVRDIGSAQKAALRLRESGVQTVILTLGENGVVIADADQCTHEAALTVNAVDTTAAGDAFVGSFATAVTEGQSIAEAVTCAKHAAALAVTKLGAQPSLPTRAEVDAYRRRGA